MKYTMNEAAEKHQGFLLRVTLLSYFCNTSVLATEGKATLIVIEEELQ